MAARCILDGGASHPFHRVDKIAGTGKSLLPAEMVRKWPDQAERTERRFILPSLPQPYQKFYSEWKDNDHKATIIHWIPKNENWSRNRETGEVKRVQDRPIPVLYPHQTHVGIWGGCGVVQGLVKKRKYTRPVPWFWVPTLHKSVVYSEILDKYLAVVITTRALELIDQKYGFDAYLLTNPAYELKSLLALKIKRKILQALAEKNFAHDDLAKQERIYEKYKQYILPAEELEWYGLTADEARAKHEAEKKKKELARIVPLKFQFRQDLINRLQDEKLKPPVSEEQEKQSSKITSWMSHLNPFAKPTGVPDENKMKRQSTHKV